MKEFFRKLNPVNIPPSMANQGGLMILRERILHSIILLVACLLPIIIIALLREHLQDPYYLPLTIGILAIILALLTRSIPYRIRGYFVVGLLYLAGLAEIAQSGRMGEFRLYMLIFVTLTSVLFDYKNSIGAIVLALGTIVGIAIYANSIPQVDNPVLALIRTEKDIITSSLFFLMVSTVTAASITMIINGLERNIKQQAVLMQAIEDERDALEERVQERTHSTTQRMAQLRTASEISRTISALSDPAEMLQQVVDLIRNRFDLYYVGIFLMDSAHKNAVLQAGTGEPGRRMIALGHQLAINSSSMIGWAITNRMPRIALDVGSEAVRFNNPNLPHTRSEMALPIIAHEDVLGALTIQSEKPNAFDESDIAILEGITDSLATALENDRLFHETRQALDEMRALNRDYVQRAWAETLETYGKLTYEYENPMALEATQPAHTVQIPLMLRDEVIGTITMEMDQPRLTAEDNAFVENVTTQTAIALENARLLHETERRAVQEQKLNELASRFSRALSIDEILRTAALELGQLPAVMDVSVQINPSANAIVRPTPVNISGNGNGKEHSA